MRPCPHKWRYGPAVLVIVKDGCVQGIYSDAPTQVRVVDWDATEDRANRVENCGQDGKQAWIKAVGEVKAEIIRREACRGGR